MSLKLYVYHHVIKLYVYHYVIKLYVYHHVIFENSMFISPDDTLLGGRNMHFLPVTFSLVGEHF